MDSFEHLIKEKGTCCICTKPLDDSKFLNLAQLDKKAAWKFPVWNNVIIKGLEDRAVGIVCDGCQEAAEKSGVGGMFKYAIEVRGDDVIMHDIEELEDVEPIKVRKNFEVWDDVVEVDDVEPIEDPEFFTGSVLDRKRRDDASFDCCLGSKKDQKHGFFGGLN